MGLTPFTDSGLRPEVGWIPGCPDFPHWISRLDFWTFRLDSWTSGLDFCALLASGLTFDAILGSNSTFLEPKEHRFDGLDF